MKSRVNDALWHVIYTLRDVLSMKPKSSPATFYWFLATWLIKKAGGAVPIVTEDVIVEYDGCKFLFAAGLPWDAFRYSMCLKTYEPKTYEYMMSLRGSIFVDVGAHIGGYSVRLAKRFTKVIALEPNPSSAKVLAKNVFLNDLRNVVVVRAAASDRAGEVTLNVPSGNDALSSIVRVYAKGGTVQVRAIALDNLLSVYDEIDLIKIDVEGAETIVLKGAEKTLPRCRRVIVEANSNSNLSALSESGFRLVDLDAYAPRNVLATKSLTITKT